MISYEEWASTCPYIVWYFDGSSKTTTLWDDKSIDWTAVETYTFNDGFNGEYKEYVKMFTSRNKYFV